MRTYVLVTAEAHPSVRSKRAIKRRVLWMAEDAARELPNLSLKEALQLVHLYAERGSPKYEKAALRHGGLAEAPDLAEVAAELAQEASD
jgi:hypothetical protein